MSPIFINYRRTKTRDKALILRWILEKEFGEGVTFQDEASIAPGAPWAEGLKSAVEQCHVLLALIHADWHKDQDGETGDKCLTRADDWIRQEIATSLKAGKKVIPVLIDTAYFNPKGVDAQRIDPPKNEWLPADLHPLFSKQAFRLRFDDLTPQNLGDLLAHIKTHLPEPWKTTERKVHQEQGGYYPGILQKEFPLPNELVAASPTSSTPYVGLRPFRREDARLFYGRSREIYDLCFKLTHVDSRLLLMDGYSGTGKSSLLQAGLIPRMEALGWKVGYARREEDKIKGLPGLLADVRNSFGGFDGPELVVLDQVEEVMTNPILTLPKEINELIDSLVNALEEDRNLKIILGFRSEFSAYLQYQLGQHVERPAFDSDNTIHALERQGVVEAIRSVSTDSSLNGPGKQFHLRFRPSKDVPEEIANRLINSNVGYHIAPLLQVNMELLWQRCRRDDGVVEITGAAIRDFIDTREALLEHYLEKIRKQVTSVQVDDQRLLALLQFYVEEKPASAVRPDREFDQKFLGDRYASMLQDACKQLYLLYSQGNGENAVTRLSHDSLAQVIHERYSRLTEEKVTSYGASLFKNLKDKIETQISALQYREALDTLDEMMTVEEQRQELYPYFFELACFWNEVQMNNTERVLKHWMNSGLLTGDQHEQLLLRTSNKADRETVRQWLACMDPGRYRDMQTRYFAPEQTVMVRIEAGTFMMGDEVGDLGTHTRPVHQQRIGAFLLSNAPVTWWQYGIFLFSEQRENDLKQTSSQRLILKGDCPASDLVWYDSIRYCNWLSAQMGLTPAYSIATDQIDPDNLNKLDSKKWTVNRIDGSTGFRLPMEAEWEFACRAGTTSKYSFGNDNEGLGDFCWFKSNSENHAHPVCTRRPNAWGLYDMHGNVWEWCYDWYSKYGFDEFAPPTRVNRVVRGGGWKSQAFHCRSAYRDGLNPDLGSNDLGFRLARSFIQPPEAELSRDAERETGAT